MGQEDVRLGGRELNREEVVGKKGGRKKETGEHR
jgi:hypothetical protein